MFLLTLALPYSKSPWLYLESMSDWPDLIWYHNGQGSGQQEWISAWPQTRFEYLGHQRTRVSDSSGNSQLIDDDFFALLKTHAIDLPMNDAFPFSGGLAGHLSYDLGLELLNVHSRHTRGDTPLAVVGLYLWCLQIDHLAETAALCIQSSCDEATRSRLEAFAQQLQGSTVNETEPAPVDLPAWQCQMDESGYQQAFQRLKDYIVAGDVYQANLTRQWRNDHSAMKLHDDLTLYRHLVREMPAPFSVFQRCPTHSLLSVSPERFIRIVGKQVMTQPIKGTRPRGKTTAEDQALTTELYNSEKDRAENLMIVDLLRNDIARHAEPGSVSVDKLFEVQSFRNVHHLVSTVSAIRRPNRHALDILRDAFPGGSITGAPKKRAMEVIDELETCSRGNYCGCSFYVNGAGDLDSNILIRTMTLTDHELSCSGGGGIVHDSVLAEEYEESAVKVRRLLRSLNSH